MTAVAHAIDAEVLDYEDLFDDYRRGLVDRLRGFGASAECLSLWVPDEDPLVSLRNLWDAAATAGQPSVTVKLGPNTVAVLSEDEVLTMAARFGMATLFTGRRGWVIEIQDLRPADPGGSGVELARREGLKPAGPRTNSNTRPANEKAPAVAPFASIYGARTTERSGHLTHAGALPTALGALTPARASADGVELALAVDPSQHVIRHARFTGAVDPVQAGVFEQFCSLLEGLPANEAAQHGTIRLEFSLRERWNARPVAGVVTPRAAAKEFELPERLIRAAAQSYFESIGQQAGDNFYDGGPSLRWLELSTDARRTELNTALAQFCTERGGCDADIELVDLEIDIRAVIRVAPGRFVTELPHMLLQLERHLRDTVEPRLELYLEEIRDRNKLRRLAVVQEAHHVEHE